MCFFSVVVTRRLQNLAAHVETFTGSRCGMIAFDMRAVLEMLGGHVCVVISWMAKDNQETGNERSEI